MRLHDGEPAAGPWRRAAGGEVLVELLAGLDLAGRVVAAVDGRSAAGKTTLTAALHAEATHRGVPCAVVHTDDLAWHHSFFDWADLLADGVLRPFRAGGAVRFVPPGWRPNGRDGAVEVPAGTRLLLVEGVGAARRDVTGLLDAVAWVQSDVEVARARGLARDVASGVNGDPEQAEAFWDEWDREEVPFQAAQRPWERARLVVAGTGGAGVPGTFLVSTRPLAG
ncbi:hypothetical protein AB2L28_08410 [Kineococcus sp. TBRC 1896]|uniref:Uridine kinase n=1 Tax=Kineococcus mangrovi TaxID=1660183 RepID=A0ABV4I0R2_9ACTN